MKVIKSIHGPDIVEEDQCIPKTKKTIWLDIVSNVNNLGLNNNLKPSSFLQVKIGKGNIQDSDETSGQGVILSTKKFLDYIILKTTRRIWLQCDGCRSLVAMGKVASCEKRRPGVESASPTHL